MLIKFLGIIATIVIIYYYYRDSVRLRVQLKKILLFPEVTYISEEHSEEPPLLEDYSEKIKKHTYIIKSSYKSQFTDEEIEYDMIIPQGCQSENVEKALILFHGIRDSKECWLEKGHLLENYIKLLEKGEIGKIAFILPNSGYNGESWYTNFSNLSHFQYEEFFSKEFIPLIKKRFPNALLGITGFSMGGYGAFKIGLKNLNYFEVIGSMAGAISLIRLILKRRVLKVFKFMYIPRFLFNSFDQKHFVRVFGSFGKRILKEDPYTILKDITYSKLNGKKFYLSVGTKDNSPYWMFYQWIDCIGRMKGYGYDFKGVLYRGEEHTWSYIDRDLKIFLKYFNDSIDKKRKK